MNRNKFQQVQRKLKAEGQGKKRLSQSTLQLIQPIRANISTYSFPILVNEANNGIQPQNDEVRLNLNDEFVATSMGVFLVAKVFTGVSPTVNDPNVFLTSPPIQNDSLQIPALNLYDGNIEISRNNIVYITNWDVRKHQYIAQSQLGNFVSPTQAQQDQQRSLIDGFVSLQPSITFSGATKTNIVLNLINAIPVLPIYSIVDNQGATINYQITRLGVFFRGLLAQNTSKFQ